MKTYWLIHRRSIRARAAVSATALFCATLLVTAMLLGSIPAAAQGRPAEPSEYVLGEGDVLSITVFGDGDLSITVPIGPDGQISVPLAGPIKAGGLTVVQLAEDIASALSTYVKNPSVTVNVAQYRKTRVVVLGQVVRPGAYELPGDARALAAIAAAGGLTDMADVTGITLAFGSGEAVCVDYESALTDPAADISLQSGAVIYVPRAYRQLLVMGDVVRPGSYPAMGGAGRMTLLDAVAAAGGVRGDARKATVVWNGVRDGVAESAQASLCRLIDAPESDENIALEPGDVLLVSEGPEDYVSIVGEVARPGVYPLQQGAAILDVIAAAGGPTLRADMGRIRVYQGSDVQGASTFAVAPDRLLFEGDILANPKASAGQLIVVPSGAITVHVTGSAVRPGPVDLMQGATLLDAVAAAGGLKPDADGQRAVLTRADGQDVSVSEIDIESFFAGGAQGAAPAAHDGDSIFIPEFTHQVLVMGAVAKPGAYRLQRGAKLLDAIAAAGGMAPGADAGAVVHSCRGSEPGSVTLDAEALLRDASLDANVLLADGDALFIPEARQQAAIMGEVARPGVYPAGRGTTLMDLLAAAGGPTGKADLGRVKVYEGQGGRAADGRLSDIAGLSLAVADESLVYEGNIKANPQIAPGQLIVVPSSVIRVQVAGHVQRAGGYELKRGADVAQAITAAGGVSTAGDGTRVVVTRRGDRGDSQAGAALAFEMDVDAILSGGAPGLELADGDTVYVPELAGQIVVLGEVARPGAYRLPRGARLLDAIAAAGGPSARASLENVTIYAGGDASMSAGAAIGQGKVFLGDGAANPQLGASDIVVVGSRVINVTVVGAAARPGVYELAAGARLLDAVAIAGGASALGDRENVMLTRGTGGRAAGADAGVDLDVLGHDPESEGNAVLADGDVIYIPEAPEQPKKQVAVLGAVARPGVYPVDEGTRLMEAMAAAGGPLDAADLARVKVYRAGEPAEGVDLEVADDRLVYDGDIKANPVVEPSSVIVVPGTEVRVYVAGFVARPGQVTLRRGATALDAIAAAGGVTSAGDGTRVAVARKTSDGAFSLEIDVTSALDAGEAQGKPPVAPLPLLEEGDALFVPEAVPGQVLVLGEVARPGAYRLQRGAKLLDAIAEAGGATARACLDNVTVYAAGRADQAGRHAIGDGRALFAGNANDNPELSPGDMVVVGSRAMYVSVVGRVARPGTYELLSGARVADAIAAAGGLAPSADAGSAVHSRRGPEPGSVVLDAEALLRDASLDVNALLADGDALFIPEAREQAAIMGEVARPGVYPAGRGTTLMDLLAAAGGPTGKADLGRVKVYEGQGVELPDGRASDLTALSLAVADDSLVYEGNIKANPQIAPGRVIVVPSAAIRVQVAGHAARPGAYELKRGAGIVEAITAAGGISTTGDGTRVVVTRRDGATGAAHAFEMNVDTVLSGEGSGLELADGDVVYIPEAPEKLKKQAAVLGAVARPGVYPIDEGTRLMEAIAAAGGPLDAADLSRVKVYNAGEPAEGVDLEVADDRLVYDGDIKANPVVEPSSVIVVPGTEVRVYVAGFVARPGQVTLRRGATALDAIAAAGGVTSAGDGTQVALVRKTGDGAFSLEIDVTSALDAREAPGKPPVAPMPLLEDGDALFVPEAALGQAVVLGEVARPGSYRLTKGARVLDLIAAAGGVTPKASLEKISIFSEGILAGPRYVSIGTGKSLLPEGSVDNPEIRAGDVIVVASRMITVNVIGAVARPGTFEIQPGASLVDAVAAAGGTRADADVARVSVARRPAQGATKSEVLTLDLEAAIGGADAETAVLMADGDVIFVPEAQGQVLVLGEVARPGAYKLPREARLLDAIAAAGGTTAKASLESVTIYKDGALAAGAAEPLGHGKVLFSGKVTENPRVSPGDVVTVGSRMIGVSVIGRAARPGSYELPAGSRVIDAVAVAGGVALDADRRSVLVIPAAKSGPSATVDLDQALRGGDVGHILSDGDVVFIPDTRQQVAVMGEVTRPGVYAYTEGMTLMEVMAMAGGPSAKADLAQVRLYRGERVEDALRLEVADDRLAFEGDIKSNPALAPGDILFVPSGRIRVQVAGHIARTGEVELRRGATILDAISAAGGLAQAGDGARVVVTRRGEGAGRVFEVDVDGLLRGGLPQAEAVGLEDGDVVFVPEANRKIAVMGGVARPGLYDYKTGMKLIEGLAMAGGPTAVARLDRVMVYSGDQAVQIALGDAKAQAMTIDPTRGNNPELKSGDIIIVPLSEKIDWSMIISILSAINQIKGIITR